MASAQDNLTALSAGRLIAGLQTGEWCSEELTAHFLERITRLNPRLHAIHSLNPDALAQARQLDARRSRGEDVGALAGLPMSIKDAFAVAGLRSTYGLAAYAWHRPRRDCRLVAALREAGAIFLGRSAVPTASFDWNTRNQVFPACVNPYAADRTPGGSSGGAAAALAAGLTPLELGSDAGGSIRYPAHCCGVWGLRTSDGWLPFADIGPGRTGFRYFAVAGPMARRLEDLVLLTEVLARAFPDSRLRPAAAESRPKRVAYSFELLGLQPDADTRAAMQAWLAQLRHQGLELIETTPPLDFASLMNDWGPLLGHEMARSLPPMPRALGIQLMDLQAIRRLGTGRIRDGVLKGMALSEGAFLAALARCRSAQNRLDRFFQAFDAWVLPVSPAPAVCLRDSGKVLETHAGAVPYAEFIGRYLCPTVLLGTPALTAPIGQSSAGLPIGVQIHGPRFGDLRLLAQWQSLLSGLPSLSPSGPLLSE